MFQNIPRRKPKYLVPNIILSSLLTSSTIPSSTLSKYVTPPASSKINFVSNHKHLPPLGSQIARNRLGLNDDAHELAKVEAEKERLKVEKEQQKAEKDKNRKRK